MMLGKKHLIAVGGKTEGSGDVSAEKRTDTTNVPVTWWPMPDKWYDELIHMFFVKLPIDLTPAEGKFAWAAIQNRVGYIGVAYTDSHRQLIMDRLIGKMKNTMTEPTSPFFNKEFCETVGVSTGAGKPESSDGGRGGNNAGRGRASGRGGGRGPRQTRQGRRC